MTIDQTLRGDDTWLQHLRATRAQLARRREELLARAEQLVTEAREIDAHLPRWDSLIAEQERTPTRIPAAEPGPAATATDTTGTAAPSSGVGPLLSGPPPSLVPKTGEPGPDAPRADDSQRWAS